MNSQPQHKLSSLGHQPSGQPTQPAADGDATAARTTVTRAVSPGERMENLCESRYGSMETARVRKSRTSSNKRHRSRTPTSMPQHASRCAPSPTTNDAAPADADILSELCQMIARSTGPGGVKLAQCFRTAGTYPPITKQSLSELDIKAIINNPKLRHDINFDRELHFRPNLDGARGRSKREAAEDYWLALTAELELYALLHWGAAALGVEDVCRARKIRISRKRIPNMFETVKDILKSLVPERDRLIVEEQLDVPMLMQEIERGVCDLNRIAQWLAILLKTHCAPLRDERVDHMVRLISKGVERSSARHVVSGLKELFGIMEMMKLDVANHQIRHLRPLLIEDTINFEHKYHADRIDRGRTNLERAKPWYRRESLASGSSRQQQTQDKDACDVQLDTFIRSLLRLVLSTEPREVYPETFNLDRDRLDCIRADLHDLIYLDICSEVFEELIRHVEHVHNTSPIDHLTLRHDLLSIIGDSGRVDRERMWAANAQNISVEIARHVLRNCGYTNAYDAGLLCKTEDMLHRAFYQSPMKIGSGRRSTMEDLLSRVSNDINTYMNSSPVDIFNTLVAPVGPPPPLPLTSGVTATTISATYPPASTLSISPAAPDYLTDIAQRLTHIAILHWRIWSPILHAPQGTEAQDTAVNTAAGASSPPTCKAQNWTSQDPPRRSSSPPSLDDSTPSTSGTNTPCTSGINTPASETEPMLELHLPSTPPAQTGPHDDDARERRASAPDASQELERSPLVLRQKEQ